MPSTSVRILRLLSLLQVRREWSGQQLARRLDVGPRTVRRDVDRLRQLGYSIDASAGVGGGYRLGAGAETPPLMLEDDEAVAVAVALGAAAGSVGDVRDVTLRVLAKLDQLLPRRLRRRLASVPAVTLSLVPDESMASLSVLASVASACRDTLQLRFSYRDMRGMITGRTIEPMRLVFTGRRWYLAAWDIVRDDWRTFRVDRIQAQPRLATGPRFVPRDPPEDFATMVRKSITNWVQPLHARVRIRGSAADLKARLPSWVGVVEPLDDSHAALTVGGDCPEMLVALLMHAGADFTLIEPPEVAQPIRDIAERLLRAVG